jgi:hypothetical protein
MDFIFLTNDLLFKIITNSLYTSTQEPGYGHPKKFVWQITNVQEPTTKISAPNSKYYGFLVKK